MSGARTGHAAACGARTHAVACGTLAIACASPFLAHASELSYTYLDIGATTVDTSLIGSQRPAAAQQVTVDLDDGEGLAVGGSLALGRRFFVAGSYESAVVEVDAVIESPLAMALVGGNVDRVATRVAVGYIWPIGENLDVVLDIGYDSREYDFGSFAGESFDTTGSGAGYGVGVRWNPYTSFELFAAARASEASTVDLSTREFDSGTDTSVGLRWYFFEDLGLGFHFQGGDLDSFALSLRFGFGDLRAGR